VDRDGPLVPGNSRVRLRGGASGRNSGDGLLSWFTDYADPARGWELALAEAATGHAINRQANRMLNEVTRAWNDQILLQQASALPTRCWFIHGSEDPRPQSTVIALSNAVPRSDLHIVHGAGHHLWCECPEAHCGLLRRLVLNTGNSWG
jgi:proline iminopeptidase